MNKYLKINDKIYHKILNYVKVKKIYEEFIEIETEKNEIYSFKYHDFGRTLFIDKNNYKTNSFTGFDYLEKNKDLIHRLREDRIHKFDEEKKEEIFDEVTYLLRQYKFKDAENHYIKNKDYMEESTYLEQKKQFLEKHKKRIIEKIHKELFSFSFNNADALFEENKEYLDVDKYNSMKEKAIKKDKENKELEKQKLIEEKIENYLLSDKFIEADEYYESNKEYVDQTYYLNRKNINLQRFINSIMEKIKEKLAEYSFLEAEKLYKGNLRYVNYNEYISLRDQYLKLYESEFWGLVKSHFINLDFESADKIFFESMEFINQSNYKKEKQIYLNIAEKIKEINQNLEAFNFKEADNIYYSMNFGDYYNISEYTNKKTNCIISFFRDNFIDVNDPFLLDYEQASAISCINKNLLVAARAGSGKTRVIVALILYLLEKHELPWDSIMALAFNRKVPEEIQNRIRKKVVLKTNPKKYSKVDIVYTFHKFSRDVSNTNEKILADKKKFLRIIIELMKEENPDFAKRIYKFFKKESTKIDKNQFIDPKHYYTYIKNLKYTTLNGETVKSIGEKWIADFLFENGLEYYYEYSFYPSYIKSNNIEGDEDFKRRCMEFLELNNNETKPDFYLKKYNLIWEHWGINEFEKNEDIKKEFSKKFDQTWEDYYNKMLWKRDFWLNWRKTRIITNEHWAIEAIVNVNKLIETSILDLSSSREEFENILKQKLKEENINVIKRSENELIQDVWEKAIDRFTTLVASFIDRYQQSYYESKEVFLKQVNNFKDRPEVYEFLIICLEIFERYEKELRSKNKNKKLKNFEQYHLDFNQLLERTIKIIDQGDADERIKKIRYLLIDEYQDFSELFYRLIEAIRKRNNNLILFCVGDDWQAINRFAGSKTIFFTEFISYFKDAGRVEISNNYRSTEHIISSSNRFMKNSGFEGKGAISTRKSTEKAILIEAVDRIIVDEIIDENIINEFTINNEKVRDFRLKTNYFKKCCEIIKENLDKEILILHRNNKFRYSMDIKKFEEKIIRVLRNENIKLDKDKIKISTMHSSKGTEADIVIILEANSNILESIHPDYRLFEIFGEDILTILDDQKRLFYVAITRAKEKVYLLCEKDKVTNYINNLI